MRFVISVAFVPRPIACNIGPICQQPDFIRHVLRAENIHPDKPCGTVDKVRTENESSLDLGIHVIGHDKSAQDANRLLFQLSNSSRKNFFSVYAYRRSARRFSLVTAIWTTADTGPLGAEPCDTAKCRRSYATPLIALAYQRLWNRRRTFLYRTHPSVMGRRNLCRKRGNKLCTTI